MPLSDKNTISYQNRFTNQLNDHFGSYMKHLKKNIESIFSDYVQINFTALKKIKIWYNKA